MQKRRRQSRRLVIGSSRDTDQPLKTKSTISFTFRITMIAAIMLDTMVSQ
jgi:hypothetical protein